MEERSSQEWKRLEWSKWVLCYRAQLKAALEKIGHHSDKMCDTELSFPHNAISSALTNMQALADDMAADSFHGFYGHNQKELSEHVLGIPTSYTPQSFRKEWGK